MSLVRNKLVRRVLLPIFARINPGDVRIRHHYTGDRFQLHSFRHKGYWFHGRQREGTTMERFAELIQAGDTVIEVGGHIGYITLYLSSLVGDGGSVHVFEPGPNNLPYLRRNIGGKANVHLMEKAVSDQDGELAFYLEDLTGQNNTLIKDYHVFESNSKFANWNNSYRQVCVDAVRLDDAVVDAVIQPDFIKIDVEGAEFLVLSGAEETLSRHRPMLMVEITNREEDVFRLIDNHGYLAFTPHGLPCEDVATAAGNVFFLHPDNHADQIQLFTSGRKKSA
ncbi:MAG: FkbM family methyltransferase [Pirellulales bacterium]